MRGPWLSLRGAVLVANAHPDVLAAASHRCPANSQDGVAWALESLVR